MGSFFKHLQTLTGAEGRSGAPLCEYTTWRMGGPADVLLEPGEEAQLATALRICRQEDVPCVLLAGGSNLLCDDGGVGGVVLRVSDKPGCGLTRLRRQGATIEVGAGCPVPRLARFAAEQGLGGLEHAGNIPGTLGGLVAMNGGSMRRSISENLLRVFALTPQGESVTLLPEECAFGYRSSGFQKNGFIVTGAVLQLEEEAPAVIRERIEEDWRVRQGKFPLHLPSCGSVFKSHERLYATHGPPGKVIEDSGLKCARRGDVLVSQQHANFFVNLGEGRARDALALIAHVREEVCKRTGVALECEVRYMSRQGVTAPAHEFLPALSL